jgi:alcohol dehydrogenase class IV
MVVRKFLVPEIIFGRGALAEVGTAVGRLGGRRVFVVTDPGVIEAGWLERALPYVREAGLAYQVWHDLTPNPKDHEVEAGFAAFASSDCDALLALGGGSVIDAAKGIAILSGNGGRIGDYEGIDKVEHPIPPLVAVPSTGGSGADVSQFAVITDTARRRKMTLIGRALVPDISITDPRLLVTMDPQLSAATGMDALSHGIEAYVSKAASFLSDAYALGAIRLVSENLWHSVETPSNLDAREGMAQASLQAGLAFTNAILGATHAVSHQLGGALDLPHGVLNAVLLPHVMHFNAATQPNRFVEVARALGVAVDGLSPAGAADAAVERVRRLADEIGVPRGLAQLGVHAADFDQFARGALDDACITTNPRPTTAEDLAGLLAEAL